MKLDDSELLNIEGGSISTPVLIGLIGTAITFIIGIADGIFRPLGCNEK